MRRRFLLAAVLAPGLVLATPAIHGDEAVVRRMATRFAETWNQHDMGAFAALFADDADFVNVAGMRLSGRDRIREEHAKRHQMQFKESVLTVRGVTVRFLRPGVAIAHVEWSMRGDRDPDGTSRPPREGVMTWTLVKKGAGWQIAAAHNTNDLKSEGSK